MDEYCGRRFDLLEGVFGETKFWLFDIAVKDFYSVAVPQVLKLIGRQMCSGEVNKTTEGFTSQSKNFIWTLDLGSREGDVLFAPSHEQ